MHRTLGHAHTNAANDGAEAWPVGHEEGLEFPVSVLHAGRS